MHNAAISGRFLFFPFHVWSYMLIFSAKRKKNKRYWSVCHLNSTISQNDSTMQIIVTLRTYGICWNFWLACKAIYSMGSWLSCFTIHFMILCHGCMLPQKCTDLLIIFQEMLYHLSRNYVSNIYIHLAIAVGAITLDWRNTHGIGLSLCATSPAWNPDISSIFQTIEFSLLFVACPRCISDWLTTHCISTKVNILRLARHKYDQWSLECHYLWWILYNRYFLTKWMTY